MFRFLDWAPLGHNFVAIVSKVEAQRKETDHHSQVNDNCANDLFSVGSHIFSAQDGEELLVSAINKIERNLSDDFINCAIL